ncbi:hypothetical protein [Pararhodobacter sp.]|uniref:hypothetical protein n=1 Tax=Pararhodobacter sp. TaxID=2127056 RepID=UPI002FDE064D
MAAQHDGGPAFPSTTSQPDAKGIFYPVHHQGMSLRDAAALAALKGIVAGYMSNPDMSGQSPQMIVDEAFQYADAFIAARSKGEGEKHV